MSFCINTFFCQVQDHYQSMTDALNAIQITGMWMGKRLSPQEKEQCIDLLIEFGADPTAIENNDSSITSVVSAKNNNTNNYNNNNNNNYNNNNNNYYNNDNNDLSYQPAPRPQQCSSQTKPVDIQAIVSKMLDYYSFEEFDPLLRDLARTNTLFGQFLSDQDQQDLCTALSSLGIISNQPSTQLSNLGQQSPQPKQPTTQVLRTNVPKTPSSPLLNELKSIPPSVQRAFDQCIEHGIKFKHAVRDIADYGGLFGKTFSPLELTQFVLVWLKSGILGDFSPDAVEFMLSSALLQHALNDDGDGDDDGFQLDDDDDNVLNTTSTLSPRSQCSTTNSHNSKPIQLPTTSLPRLDHRLLTKLPSDVFNSSQSIFDRFTKRFTNYHRCKTKSKIMVTTGKVGFQVVEPSKEDFDCVLCGDSIFATPPEILQIARQVVGMNGDYGVVFDPEIIGGVTIEPCEHKVCLGCLTEHVTVQLEQRPLAFFSRRPTQQDKTNNNAGGVAGNNNNNNARAATTPTTTTTTPTTANSPDNTAPSHMTYISCPCDPGCQTRIYSDLILAILPVEVCEKYQKRTRNVLNGRLDEVRHAQFDGKRRSRLTEAQKRKEDEASEALVGRHQKCPNCAVPIWRDNGCDHMTCSQCKHEFCYLCLKPHKLGNHSGCKNDSLASL